MGFCTNNVARGVAVRLLFAAHLAASTLLLVIMHGVLNEPSIYWAGLVTVAPLICEAIFTLVKTKGDDWKWLSPGVLCYVAGGSAITWLLESRVLQYSDQGALACGNVSLSDAYDELNGTSDWESYCRCGHCNAAAEQLFIAFVFIGRWLLPRGRVPYSKEDNVNHFLQQIAKVHYLLSMACNAADALDFINSIRQSTTVNDRALTNIIIIVWALSLCQFSLVTTATRESKDGAIRIFLETDGWANLAYTLLDDIPYLGVRVYLVYSYRLLNNTVLFFMVKNVMMVCATLQKLVATCRMTSKEEVEEFVTVEAATPRKQVIAVQPQRRGEQADDLDTITLANKGSMLSVITRRAGGNESRAIGASFADSGFLQNSSPTAVIADGPSGGASEKTSLLPSGDGAFQLQERAPSAAFVLGSSDSLQLVTMPSGGSERAASSMSTASAQYYFTHAYASAKDQETRSGPEKVKNKIKLPLGKAVMSGLRLQGITTALQNAIDKTAKRLSRRTNSSERRKQSSGNSDNDGVAYEAAGRQQTKDRAEDRSLEADERGKKIRSRDKGRKGGHVNESSAKTESVSGTIERNSGMKEYDGEDAREDAGERNAKRRRGKDKKKSKAKDDDDDVGVRSREKKQQKSTMTIEDVEL